MGPGPYPFPTPEPERSVEDRLTDLEIAVFGSLRQRAPGLIDSMKELTQTVTALKKQVEHLSDNRRWWVQMVAQLATFAAAAAALVAALRAP